MIEATNTHVSEPAITASYVDNIGAWHLLTFTSTTQRAAIIAQHPSVRFTRFRTRLPAVTP